MPSVGAKPASRMAATRLLAGTHCAPDLDQLADARAYELCAAKQNGPIAGIKYDPIWIVGDGEDVVALVRGALQSRGLAPDTPAGIGAAVCPCPQPPSQGPLLPHNNRTITAQ